MQHRRPAALLGAAALVAAAGTFGSAAQAADTPRTGLGEDGQKLTVSASANLDPEGETLRVTGSGYDARKAVRGSVDAARSTSGWPTNRTSTPAS